MVEIFWMVLEEEKTKKKIKVNLFQKWNKKYWKFMKKKKKKKKNAINNK